MEQSFADLLSDAFSDTAAPSFPDGDLEFEDLNFEEKFDKTDTSEESFLTKEDEALQQEATGHTDMEKEIEMAENAEEEQCDVERDEEDSEGVTSRDKTTEDSYTSSGSEQEVSGEDEEDEEEDMRAEGERPGDLLRSVRCGVEFCDKEDTIFAEGEPPAPGGAENPQVRNEKQGDSDEDEEVSYFERVPERGTEVMIRGDGTEEDEQEREEEKVGEGMKIEQEENVLCFEQEVESPHRDDQTKASLEFPEISVQNLQDLIAEVDSEEYGEKMKDFSGDEHQDAGESIAEYPSDFSSCEYVEDGGKNQESSACASNGGSMKQSSCLERAEDDEGDGYLYSRDLEVGADTFKSWDVATGEEEVVENVSGETSESDSYTSSDDDVQEKRSDEELFVSRRLQDLESNKQLEEPLGGSDAAFSDDSDRENPADFNINWNLDVLTTNNLLFEDLLTTDEAETPLLDVTQRPAAEDVNSYSEVQREDATTTSPSNQGSVDDSFFFNAEAEASGVTELGQLGDDEYEEERNWEQEQQRIKAFYEFYDDSDEENEGEGRQIKVQFCADPLSRVIHYQTDSSSDRDSDSSSTEGEEDLSSAETSEELREPENTTQTVTDHTLCDPPNTELPEDVPDISITHCRTRKHKCFDVLTLTLKMGLVILAGLLMFWFATDQAGWFSHGSFF